MRSAVRVFRRRAWPALCVPLCLPLVFGPQRGQRPGNQEVAPCCARPEEAAGDDVDRGFQGRSGQADPTVAATWRALMMPSAARASAAPAAQDQGKGLGPGPAWRGPVRPTAANEVFATGDGCAMCHSAAPAAIAMRSATGEDVSPHGLWQATMMANSFRDPYWQAQVARESAAAPERAGAVQALCLRCHAPMAHHSAKLGGAAPPDMAAAAADPLAQDGVSCTVCHQIRPDGLGTPATFSGQGVIQKGRAVFGPYAEPAARPMAMHSGFEATHGPHIRDSGLCASCHTLFTAHAGEGFPEQTPFLEWQNSVYAAGPDMATCQQCHMPDQGAVRIARNPGGRDFNIQARPDYAAHAFVGGNAFMLDILREHRDDLGVRAPAEALRKMATATRQQLSDRTAELTVGPMARADGHVAFDVTVTNRTGHKLPTGYPARRVWLEVQVRAGNRVVFHSGAWREDGRLTGVDDELAIPHRTRIEAPGEVVVYEMVAADTDGRATTSLTRMAVRTKDSRLLPRGWQAQGPGAEHTAPVGVDGDADFTAGQDVVRVRVPVPDDAGELTVVAWLRYQSVPPAWVDGLRAVEVDAAQRFVRYYDAADRTPETLAIGVGFER